MSQLIDVFTVSFCVCHFMGVLNVGTKVYALNFNTCKLCNISKYTLHAQVY